MAQATEAEIIEVLEYAITTLKNTPPSRNKLEAANIVLAQAEGLLMLVTKEVQSARDMGLIA